MTDKKEKALRAMLTSSTRREAAMIAKITEATLRGYLSDDDFKEAYERILAQLLDEAVTSAKMALSPALTVLMEIAEDAMEAAPARVSAARGVLEFALRIIEKNETARKLAELEDVLRRLEEGQNR